MDYDIDKSMGITWIRDDSVWHMAEILSII